MTAPGLLPSCALPAITVDAGSCVAVAAGRRIAFTSEIGGRGAHGESAVGDRDLLADRRARAAASVRVARQVAIAVQANARGAASVGELPTLTVVSASEGGPLIRNATAVHADLAARARRVRIGSDARRNAVTFDTNGSALARRTARAHGGVYAAYAARVREIT